MEQNCSHGGQGLIEHVSRLKGLCQLPCEAAQHFSSLQKQQAVSPGPWCSTPSWAAVSPSHCARETSNRITGAVKTTLSHRALLWLQSLLKKVPSSFELASQKKGYRRYMSPPLRELVAAHAAAQEIREAALSGILQVSVPLR